MTRAAGLGRADLHADLACGPDGAPRHQRYRAGRTVGERREHVGAHPVRQAAATDSARTRDRLGAELTEPDVATFYSPGPAGYVDYPTLTPVA
jgi:hypothetical protein